MAKKTEGVRFEDAAKAYLRTREIQVKKATYLTERNMISAIRKTLGGNHWLSTLDETFWWEYFYGDEGRARTLAPSSFNGDLRRCKAFVNFCIRRGWLPADAASFLREDVGRRKTTRRQRMILTPAQLIELPEHAAFPTHRIALAIGANTALRGSEIMGIKLGKVFLDRGEMLTKLYKTDDEAMVPITSRLDGEIRRWLEDYEKMTVDQGLGPLQPRWHLVPAQMPGRDREPGSTGYTKTSPNRLRLRPDYCPTHPHVMVQLAMNSMGIEYEKGEGFHTTRRAFARALYDGLVAQGDPGALRKTSAMLHHANTGMTEVYLGLTTETVAVSQTLKGRDFLGNLLNSVALTG